MRLVAGSEYVPKQNSLKPQGEDAHFISAKVQTIGVADGVGGWSKKGVDAGYYARELMLNAHSCALKQRLRGITNIDPKRVIEEAYFGTRNRGSSTACIVTLSDHVLHAFNVGDGGFRLIRGGRIVFASPSQQRGFNCPFQLGNTRDNPSLGEEFRVEVEEGDVVVVGTDGLFDNVFGKQLEKVVRLWEHVGFPKDKPQLLAQSIAGYALVKSMYKFGLSPYATAAGEAGCQHVGGKPDDITVVVAYVVE